MNYSVTLNDMNPIVEVDQASIAQHVSGNITGVIYWRSNDHCFPDDNWNDFVVVLLGWWTKAITRLLLGCSRSETFDFMDGPFSMLCTTATDVIDCQFIERRQERHLVGLCTGRTRQMGQTLLSAGNTVLRCCHTKEFHNPDVTVLQHEVNKLRNILRPDGVR